MPAGRFEMRGGVCFDAHPSFLLTTKTVAVRFELQLELDWVVTAAARRGCQVVRIGQRLTWPCWPFLFSALCNRFPAWRSSLKGVEPHSGWLWPASSGAGLFYQ